MLDDDARSRIDALLDAVRTRPDRLPLAELAAVGELDVDVSIERADDADTVVVSPKRDPRIGVLSERELEVATLVVAGFRNRQIADALFISEATVKDHVHAILTKTGFASRSELTAAWYGNGP